MLKKINLNNRSSSKEFLDKKNIDKHELIKNLKEFIIINKYLGSQATLIQALNKIYNYYSQDFINRKLMIADLGCGAGDLLIELHKWGQGKNLSIDLIGIDNNPTIVDFATNQTLKYNNIAIKNFDIFSFVQQEQNIDIVCLNNVCHHFSDEEIIDLIEILSSKVKLAIIINDLRRNIIAYYTIKWLSKILRLSKLAQHDGPLSVLRAFKKAELIKYLMHAKIKNFEINKRWAFRWQIILPAKNV